MIGGYANIPPDRIAELQQLVWDDRLRRGSIEQVFINDSPTICDWGLERIDGDDWMEADAWHLCGDCYRALMKDDHAEWNARRRKELDGGASLATKA